MTDKITTKSEMDLKAEIQDSFTRDKLFLSDHYLTLAKPFYENPGTQNWKDFGTEWTTIIQYIVEDTKANPKKDWLNIFDERCELHYNQHYRKCGVSEFFRSQHSEQNMYAAYIRSQIEDFLFNEWHSGKKSILEIEKYLSLLIDDGKSRIQKFSERIAQCEMKIDRGIIPEISKCKIEYCNIGWLMDAVTHVSSRIFSKYESAKCEFYIMKTRIEGYAYACELLSILGLEKELIFKIINNQNNQ